MTTSGREQGNRLVEVVATEGRELEADFAGSRPRPIRGSAAGSPTRSWQRLAAHAAARREVLYPRVSRDVPDGDSLVDLGILALDQVERTGREIADLSGAEATFHQLVTKLATEVWEHLDEEEGEPPACARGRHRGGRGERPGRRLARAGAAAGAVARWRSAS